MAYAANAAALKLLMHVCDDGLLRSLLRSLDRFGRSPLDVLSLYSEETIMQAQRVRTLQKSGVWSEVSFESRRREFRSLLTTLL